MTSMVIRFLACVAAVPLCTYLFDPHVTVQGGDYTYAVIAGAVLGLIYLVLRPVMKLLLSILGILTLGLVYVLLDAWLVMLCCWVTEGKFQVEGFWWALAVAAVVNVSRSIFGKMFKSRK